jgi:hypothetical protein
MDDKKWIDGQPANFLIISRWGDGIANEEQQCRKQKYLGINILEHL